MPRSSLGMVAAWLILVAIAAPGTAAQPPAAGPQPAVGEEATELSRIRVALERIAASLERQLEGQRADLALRRLDMEEEKTLRLESQIADLVASREGLEDERFRMQSQLLAIARDAERPESSYADADVAQLREQAELEIAMTEARIAELDRRRQLLENELAERRETVRAWQSFIDRHLQIER